MHGCQPFFSTSSLKEAKRLLSVIVKDTGGKTCFHAHELSEPLLGAPRRNRFAIYFDADKYTVLFPDTAQQNVARFRSRMACYLSGYLAGEAAQRRLESKMIRLNQRRNEERRHGL